MAGTEYPNLLPTAFMKITTFMLLSSLTFGNAQCFSDPSTFCSARADGLYADACSATCSTYFQCANHVGYRQSCPSGLRFNPIIIACDWPANVQCGGSGTNPPPVAVSASPPVTASKPPPATASPPLPTMVVQPPPPGGGSCTSGTSQQRGACFCANHADGYYADSGCAGYYQCYNSGLGSYYACPMGTLFDANKQVCNWANQVTCSTPVINPTSPPQAVSPSPSNGLSSPVALSPSLSPNPVTASPPPSTQFPPAPPIQPNTCQHNVVYWGQNSAGSTYPNDQSKWEKPLGAYCQDSSFSIIVVSFLDVFFSSVTVTSQIGMVKLPNINLANHCGDTFASYPGLLSCPSVGQDIAYCQSRGKKVLLSLGGAAGLYGFSSDTQAATFAYTIWSMFLGGSDPALPRPFGAVVMDGVDLDIEGGGSQGYAAFVNSMRAKYATDSSRRYYVSGAPQCPFPDAYLGPSQGTALQTTAFDFVFVQFYNNYCGATSWGTANFNFQQWVQWAQSSANPNVKVLLGVPASPAAAGSGYVTPAQLANIVNDLNNRYPSTFGGVMMWDAGQSDNNISNGMTFGANASSMLWNRC